MRSYAIYSCSECSLTDPCMFGDIDDSMMLPHICPIDEDFEPKWVLEEDK